MEVGGKRRVVRLVVEVPDAGQRPLVVSVHQTKKKAAAN